jgi:uncharacterized protein YlbG (UPF0298 family)
MRRVTIYITDDAYDHFIELAKNLHYVKKIETDEVLSEDDVKANIKKGFEEMQFIKKGTLKTTTITDFLNEL